MTPARRVVLFAKLSLAAIALWGILSALFLVWLYVRADAIREMDSNVKWFLERNI